MTWFDDGGNKPPHEPPPGSVAVCAVAWSDPYNGGPSAYDPPQGAGWITPDGKFIPQKKAAQKR